MYQRTQAHEEAFSWHLGQLATEAKEAALLGSIPTSSVAVENPAIADITVLKLAPRSVLTRFPSVGGVRTLNLENCLLSFAPFAVCRHLDSWHPLSLTLSPRSTVRKVTSTPSRRTSCLQVPAATPDFNLLLRNYLAGNMSSRSGRPSQQHL